jgi:dolichol-phosphate mannosyltransferase
MSALPNIAWEAIFVDDDSPDGTSEHVRALARSNPRIRCLQRIGRRGLATACIEGVLASASPFVAVMDADLQHDARLLPHMLKELESGVVDLVVGSRYASEEILVTGASVVRGLVRSERAWHASSAKPMLPTR